MLMTMLGVAFALLVGTERPKEQTSDELGSPITVTGFLDNAKSNSIIAQLEKRSATLNSVLFSECHAGTLGASVELAQYIRDHSVSTVAAGQVTSGCAIAFLAGRTRRIDLKNDYVLIGLHNGRTPAGEPMQDREFVIRQMEYFLRARFDEKIRSLLRDAHGEAAGVFFYFRRDGSEVVETVKHCDGSQGTDFMKCAILGDVTADGRESLPTKPGGHAAPTTTLTPPGSAR